MFCGKHFYCKKSILIHVMCTLHTSFYGHLMWFKNLTNLIMISLNFLFPPSRHHPTNRYKKIGSIWTDDYFNFDSSFWTIGDRNDNELGKWLYICHIFGSFEEKHSPCFRFFVCTELMGLIEDRFPGKFVEFAESNFKFCFPNPAPIERLNVWNNVKLTGMSMTEYFQDAQVEIQDCDDDEEKVLFFAL